MAILAGAGNPAGSGGTAGTGKGLNYAQGFAWAFAGTTGAAESTAIVLDFTTGSSLFKGTIFATGTVNYASSDLVAGVITAWKISLDDQIVGFLKTDSAKEEMPQETTMPIIIPPYTHVKIEILSTATSATSLNTTSITGRVYY